MAEMEPEQVPASETTEAVMDLSVTDKAKEQLRKAFQAQGKEGYGLKVGVTPGGCAGLQYSLAFLKEPQNGEHTVEKDGFKFFVEPNHAPVLDGITIDYVDTMMGGGFKIQNPNAETSCGCGKSFG